MMALARVVAEYPHAVQREMLCYRYRWEDFGEPDATLLTSFGRFASFVLGAPPSSSALGLAVHEGWTFTDHLIAHGIEAQQGLIHLTGRFSRPGAPEHGTQKQTQAQAEPETPAKPTAQQVQTAVALGGQFDVFDSPNDFEAALAAFKARRSPQVGDGLVSAVKEEVTHG
jgi:hypothetical protein